MERFVEPKERLPFTQKSAEELALEMNKALEDVTEMTEEELLEDDAEGGYFDDLAYYEEDENRGIAMEITIEQVKEFAWQQLDAMWHDNSGTATINMVRFDYKGYCIVNPWMDEKTEKAVDPYRYYGKQRTEQFVKEAIRTIQHKH